MSTSALVTAVQALGASRVEALLVGHLLKHGQAATSDLMATTGLRQPEVSVGMRVLRERGWVQAEPIPRAGKGRPMHAYRLVAPAATVRNYYEGLGQAAMRRFETALHDLRRLA